MSAENKHIWTGVFNYIDLHDTVIRASCKTLRNKRAEGYNLALSDCLDLLKRSDEDGVPVTSINYDSLCEKFSDPDALTAAYDNFIYGYSCGIEEFKMIINKTISDHSASIVDACLKIKDEI